MFENILHQEITKQLVLDIESASFAPAVLFSGPPASGKGTAALELARVLSCEEEKALWNCSCPSCVRHRALVSQDTLLLGQKSFFAEISACAKAWERDLQTGSRRLFVRSIRKLLVRFSPVLWEDDSRLAKVKNIISDIEEDLEEFETKAEHSDKPEDMNKLCALLLKNAVKLESGGMGELIPIAHIRKAAYWSRLAPAGRHKSLIIENADRMQDGAKNSLLKILEEPPRRLTIILTCVRPGTLLPTMLSRLRHYRFVQRSIEEEADVIRRIFREKDGAAFDAKNHPLGAYLESFLPVDNSALYPLGAYFAASMAAAAARELKTRGHSLPGVIGCLGKFASPIAEQGGMGRPAPDYKTAAAAVFKGAGGFEIPGLFAAFCKNMTALLSAWLRDPAEDSGLFAEKTRIAGLWKTGLDNAFSASDLYNIQTVMVFERLGEHLKNALLL